MSQLNDCILQAVGATGESQLNDGLRAHYLANGATGANGLALEDLEYEFLVANGATSGQHLQDMWLQVLPAVVGFSGDLNDMLLPFWCAGGTFAPPDSPLFNANPVGSDPWPASFEATEEAQFSFDCRPYWADGGFISQWSLSGTVPTWMTISNNGIISGTPPQGDVDYAGLVVTGNNATGPAASSPSTPVNTPVNVAVTFDPQTQFVEIGQTVTFAAQASNVSGYQWYKNNVLIPGATSFAYTASVTNRNENGDEYFCRCEGVGGVTKDTQKAQVRTMQTYNNNADGSGALVRTITLAAGTYVLSMSGSGLVELRAITASIIGIGG